MWVTVLSDRSESLVQPSEEIRPTRLAAVRQTTYLNAMATLNVPVTGA
jgi:hypothetical protein